jgi:hypothetical protein
VPAARLSALAKIVRMNRRVKMTAAAIAVALLLAGGAIAAVTATGRGTGHPRAGQRVGHDLRTASSYLGIPVAQIQSELRSGRSLAQIAQAAPGHSADGLISALLSAKRARLAKAASVLPRIVRAEVQRIGGPGAGPFGFAAGEHGKARFGALAGIGLAAASYIGLTPRELRAQLEGGRTLAEVAHAHNRSEAGLVAAVMSARKRAVESAVLAGAITKARATSVLAHLQARAQRLVKRSFARR